MPSDQNSTITLTPDQLATIEADEVKAEAAIQQAGTQTPAVSVWRGMYRDLLAIMTTEGISGPQAYWFQEAGAINADDLSDPAGFFVRDITALGFNVSLTDPILQNVSNTIGQNIYDQILANIANGSSSLSLAQQLQQDIGAAIKTFGLPIGSWGGAFYYWNFQYDPNSSVTVGQTIESDPQQRQTFITNNAQAMADTIYKFGIDQLNGQQASRCFSAGLQESVG